MTVYLSFTATIGRLVREELSFADLDAPSTLFFFGCSRDHAMWADKARDGVDEWEWAARGHRPDPTPPEDIIVLKKEWKLLLETAEKAGRYVPRTRYGTPNEEWELLRSLLARNGVAARVSPIEKWGTVQGYNYPAAKEWLATHGVAGTF